MYIFFYIKLINYLGKRVYNENSNGQNKNKRMSTTTSSIIVLTKSAFNGLCKEYLKKTLMVLKMLEIF